LRHGEASLTPQHVAHRKHRKFAEKLSNWTELDAMIRRVERPLGAAYKAACVFNGLLPPPSDEPEPSWRDQTSSSIRRQRRARDELEDEDEASDDEGEESMAVDEDEGADENQEIIDVDAEDDDEDDE